MAWRGAEDSRKPAPGPGHGLGFPIPGGGVVCLGAEPGSRPLDKWPIGGGVESPEVRLHFLGFRCRLRIGAKVEDGKVTGGIGGEIGRR